MMPTTEAVYVHRVGRTARAGAKGRAVSLVGDTGFERKLLKQIISHSKNPEDCKHRVVPGPVLLSWKKKIEKLEPQVKDVMTQEKEEKWVSIFLLHFVSLLLLTRKIKTADMEANKAHNMIQHADEIANRPARVWFQSEREKNNTKVLTKAQNQERIENPDAASTPTKLPTLPKKLTRKVRNRDFAVRTNNLATKSETGGK